MIASFIVNCVRVCVDVCSFSVLHYVLQHVDRIHHQKKTNAMKKRQNAQCESNELDERSVHSIWSKRSYWNVAFIAALWCNWNAKNEMGANWNISFRWTFSKSLEIEWEIVDFYGNSICLYISHVLLSIRLYTQWVKCTSLARLLGRLVMTLWNKCLSLVFTCFHSMNSVWHSTWYRNEIEIVSSFKLNQYGEEVSYYYVLILPRRNFELPRRNFELL